ncbi:hypothetical protein [Methylobacillus glycogenes]|uniref:hypothetical protein n=1 Tax=Methylobacillus glycogenes TaxID=406 RepID=UPI0011DC7538|nr:hypothetical protein [Methylobacillus glycogenes]
MQTKQVSGPEPALQGRRRTRPFHGVKWLTTIIYIVSGCALVLGHQRLGIIGLTISHSLLLMVFSCLQDIRLILQYCFFVVFDLIVISHWFS